MAWVQIDHLNLLDAWLAGSVCYLSHMHAFHFYQLLLATVRRDLACLPSLAIF